MWLRRVGVASLATDCTSDAHESSKGGSTLHHDLPQLCQQFSAPETVPDPRVRPEYGTRGHPHSEADHGAEFDAIEAAGLVHLTSHMCWHLAIMIQ